MSLVDRLRGFLVLETFSLQQLAALAEIGEEREAAKGTVLFRDNEDATEMIFLLDGAIELRSHGNHIHDVAPLSLVGEMGVLRREPRVASATVTASCRYLAVKGDDFRRLTEEDPELGRKFFQNLCLALMEQLKKNNLLVEFVKAIG